MADHLEHRCAGWGQDIAFLQGLSTPRATRCQVASRTHVCIEEPRRLSRQRVAFKVLQPPPEEHRNRIRRVHIHIGRALRHLVPRDDPGGRRVGFSKRLLEQRLRHRGEFLPIRRLPLGYVEIAQRLRTTGNIG